MSGRCQVAVHPVRGSLVVLVENGSDIFNISRAGISKINCNLNSFQSRNLHNAFLPERIIPYWNTQPVDFKNSYSVNNFKIHLENDCMKKEFVGIITGKFLMR